MKVQSETEQQIVARAKLLWVLVGITWLWPCGQVYAQAQNSLAALNGPAETFTAAAEQASPAVVGITTDVPGTMPPPSMEQWPFSRPFGRPGEELFGFSSRGRPSRWEQYDRLPVNNGSGFIISEKGYILTTDYLVAGADRITVVLLDGRVFTAQIVGTDPDSDVAVIKIEGENLPVLGLADSDKAQVGARVLAIGNPLGLNHTVTSGIVSAKGRSDVHLARYEDFIQTDAAINFGNAGGPLVDLNGKAVGMNIAGLGYGGHVGIGFAIPSNMAKWIADQLIETREVVRGFLGAQFQDMTGEMAEAFGLKTVHGVLVPEVAGGSPAAEAGLRQNDVILEIDGQAVKSTGQLRNRIAMSKPDTQVKLLVLRDGQRQTLTATLGKRPEREYVAGPLRREPRQPLGLSVRNLTPRTAQHYGYQGQSGVIVDDVMTLSIAAQEGISPGMLIKQVDKEPVRNTREFAIAMRKARQKGQALLLVANGRYSRFILLDFGREYEQANANRQ
jgi:serine protease Do